MAVLAQEMNAQTRLTLVSAIDPVSVEVLHGVTAFRSLKSEWDALFARAGRPHQLFQSHVLLDHWATAYADEASGTIIIAARAGERLAAIVPLALNRTLGVKRLRIMGAPIAQFDDALIDPDYISAIKTPLWHAISTLGADLFETYRVRADSALGSLLPTGGVLTEKSDAPFACLSSRVCGHEPGPAYSAKERSNVRRRQRRLAELGSLAMTSYPPGDEAGMLAVCAIDIKRRALKAAGIISPAVRGQGFEHFFRSAALDPASGLLVTAIELDGKPAAIDLSFLCKATAFGHVLATEPAMVQSGAGSVLVHHVLATAKAAGARTFDLLAPADSYKLQHADATTPVASTIYPLTLSGQLFVKAYHGMAIPMARRLVRKLARG